MRWYSSTVNRRFRIWTGTVDLLSDCTLKLRYDLPRAFMARARSRAHRLSSPSGLLAATS